MLTEQNKAAKRRYIAAFNRRDLTVFDELFAAGYTLRPTGFPEVHGADELKKLVAASFDSLSNVQLTAEDMVAEDDKVATRWTIRAVHSGNFMGVAATGRELSFSGIIIDRFVDGKVVEAWENVDMLGLMRQLGSIPPSG